MYLFSKSNLCLSLVSLTVNKEKIVSSQSHVYLYRATNFLILNESAMSFKHGWSDRVFTPSNAKIHIVLLLCKIYLS